MRGEKVIRYSLARLTTIYPARRYIFLSSRVGFDLSPKDSIRKARKGGGGENKGTMSMRIVRYR